MRDRSAMVKFVNQPKEDYSSLQKRKLPYPYPYKTKLKSVQNFKMEPLREHGQSVNSFFKNKIGHKIKKINNSFFSRIAAIEVPIFRLV